jgi:hypothetical protein
MWNWYSRATECFAYLVDVGSHPQGSITSQKLSRRELWIQQLPHSTWFRRGWTLQELLAPRIVTFLTVDWEVIGRKDDPDLLPIVAERTKIPESCLMSQFMLHTKCVAQRLSWAANRTTTRDEDMAYCLLGLVGVSMPLLYGEGDKAFLRLQQEIVRQTDDESIFAWRYISPPRGFMSGILAPHVSYFRTSNTVRLLDEPRPPYAITNKGLEFRSAATLIPSVAIYIIPLNCEYSVEREVGRGRMERCSIAIRCEDNAYYRVFVSRLGEHSRSIQPETPTERLPEATYYIRLSRWQHQYQPAISILTKSVLKWRKRKGQAARGEAMSPLVSPTSRPPFARTSSSSAIIKTWRRSSS